MVVDNGSMEGLQSGVQQSAAMTSDVNEDRLDVTDHLPTDAAWLSEATVRRWNYLDGVLSK